MTNNPPYELDVSVEYIDPQVATEYLGKNTNNRRKKPGLIKKLVRDIESGRFKLNGETIVFADTGRLLDGQNRLMAVIEAGKGVWSLVVNGVPEDAFDTFDAGISRYIADALTIRGEVNTVMLASAVSTVWKYYNGCVDNNTVYPTPVEAELFLDKNPGIRKSVAYLCQDKDHRATNPMPPSMVAAFHYLFSRVDEDLADSFLEEMATGEIKHKPFLLFRERLLKNKISVAKLSRVTIMALLIKTWNAIRAGEVPQVLKWTNDEGFPVLDGIKLTKTPTPIKEPQKQEKKEPEPEEDDSNAKVGPLDKKAVKIGMSLLEPFTATDLQARLDGHKGRAFEWISAWKRQDWLKTVGFGSYKRSPTFGE